MKSPSIYRSEDALHQACAGYLNARLLPPAWWTTFPAGGGGKDRGSRLKRMGMKAGVPDLLIFVKKYLARSELKYLARSELLAPTYESLSAYGIELKTKKGVISSVQSRTHQDMITAGFQISVARSLEDLKQTLDVWRIPLRHVSPSTERLMLSLNAWQEANFDLSSL